MKPAGSLRLSVIIAAYNEERTIAAIVDQVRALPLEIEIIAVNDASTDGTGKALDQLKALGKLDVVVHHSCNRGMGGGALHRHRLLHLGALAELPPDHVQRNPATSTGHEAGDLLRLGVQLRHQIAGEVGSGRVEGDVIVVQDADLENDRAELLKRDPSSGNDVPG